MENRVFVTVLTPSLKIEIIDAKVAASIEKLLFGLGGVTDGEAVLTPPAKPATKVAVHRHIVHASSAKPNMNKRWSPEDLASLASMVSSGTSRLKIAKALGRTKQAVIIKASKVRHGVSPTPHKRSYPPYQIRDTKEQLDAKIDAALAVGELADGGEELVF